LNNVLIAPSILAADFTILGKQVTDAQAGGADLIHIDVMDGRFVPNITMGPLIIEAVRRVTTLPLDVHLMIVEPEKYIDVMAKAGANMISVHYEACPHLHRVLQQIRDAGCRVGVAINPHIPASFLSEVMDMIDYVNVMTVNPGFGGQTILRSTLPKITQLSTMARQTGRQIGIEVDGGINEKTASTVVQAGANILIAGSTIFNEKRSVAEGIHALRSILEAQ
jgi:ribulose-phosphate 3-epimerase